MPSYTETKRKDLYPMKDLDKMLFLDIETVPSVPSYHDLSPALQKDWMKKMDHGDFDRKRPQNTVPSAQTVEEIYLEEAALYPEFAKIVAVSIGMFTGFEDNMLSYKAVNYVADDEHALLTTVNDTIGKYINKQCIIVGHNTNNFDRPFMAKRSFYLGIDSPFHYYGSKKPWEILDLDTMEFAKFGSRFGGTSLSVLADLLGIPSPKDDINGKEVGALYYKNYQCSGSTVGNVHAEIDLPRIAEYCGKDVLTVAKIAATIKGFDHRNIVSKDPAYQRLSYDM